MALGDSAAQGVELVDMYMYIYTPDVIISFEVLVIQT
jgi:hypothetical protein